MTFSEKYCRQHAWEGLSHEHCPRCERLHEQRIESSCTYVHSLQRFGSCTMEAEAMFEDEEGEWVRFSDVVAVSENTSELADAMENLLEAWDEFQNPEDGVAQDARELLAKRQRPDSPAMAIELSTLSPRESLSLAMKALGIVEDVGLWRSRFEAWASLYPWFVIGEDSKERDDVDYVYADHATDIAWLAWLQATRTAGKYYAYT